MLILSKNSDVFLAVVEGSCNSRVSFIRLCLLGSSGEYSEELMEQSSPASSGFGRKCKTSLLDASIRSIGLFHSTIACDNNVND